MINKMNNQRGLTFAEVMVSTLIFMFLVAGIYTALIAGNHSWAAHTAYVKAQQQARNALAYMTRELRVATGITLTQTSSNVTLNFTHPSYGVMSYAWTSDAGSTQNQLRRTTASGTTVIAQDIKALVITNNSLDIIVDLTVTGEIMQETLDDFQLVKKIAKR